MLSPSHSRVVTEDLTDLHESAWWTGVRVSVATPNRMLSDVIVHVRLMKSDGTPAIDLGFCDWIQTSRTWRKFPWAIPAAMATALDLRLEATLINIEELDAINEPIYIGLKTCFHEMPHIPSRDNYLFVDENGRILQHWNGLQNAGGTPRQGDDPVWNAPHRVVADGVVTNKIVCIQSWNDLVVV